MKVLKWIGIGVGGLAALAGITIAVVFALTASAASAADAFLAQVGQARYEEAYRSTAPQFQTDTSLDTFRSKVERFGLDKYQSVSWNSREIGGGKTRLEGTVRTRDGRTVRVKVWLVKEGDVWKVYGMHMLAGGVT